jgi:hypothetical protein
MQTFEEVGYLMDECKTLNTVRLHQQSIFELDIFNADGITINPKYLQPKEVGDKLSSLHFGIQ